MTDETSHQAAAHHQEPGASRPVRGCGSVQNPESSHDKNSNGAIDCDELTDLMTSLGWNYGADEGIGGVVTREDVTMLMNQTIYL